LITIASKANNVTRENKEKKEKSFKEYGNIIHGSRGTPRQDTRWEPGMNKASFYKLKQGAESLDKLLLMGKLRIDSKSRERD